MSDVNVLTSIATRETTSPVWRRIWRYVAELVRRDLDRRRLSEMDDRMRADIGLDRAFAEMHKSIWEA